MANKETPVGEPAKKLLIVHILEILKKHSDREHKLSQSQIVDYLKKEYNQTVDYKAIKRNLMLFISIEEENNECSGEYGVCCTKKFRKNKDGTEEAIYYDWYMDHGIEDSELRYIIDGLLFTNRISSTQRNDLIKKLTSLTSEHFDTKAANLHTEEPCDNKEFSSLFRTIEVLDKAISDKKRVEFHYIRNYGIDKKPIIQTKNDGSKRVYKMNPYYMVVKNYRYYLICNSLRFPEDIANYRIDRIRDIRLLDEDATPINEIPKQKNFKLKKYMADNLHMFGGDVVTVKFLAKKFIIRDILDWFGADDVLFEEHSEEDVYVSAKATKDSVHYWALHYGENVEILEPADVRERIEDAVRGMYEKYCEET